MHENPTTNGAATAPHVLVQQNFDALVLKAIGAGHCFTRDIAKYIDVVDFRLVDNALRRLKTANKVRFLGAKADQGWRAGPPKVQAVPVAPKVRANHKPRKAARKAPRKPKVTRKAARPVRAAKKATRATPGHLANVHCFLAKSLVKHVKKQLKPGETFTDAVAAGLSKKYGNP